MAMRTMVNDDNYDDNNNNDNKNKNKSTTLIHISS